MLGNDVDRAGWALHVVRLNGKGGLPPLHAESLDGASITMNANGSFTYDPSTSARLTSLHQGQVAFDWFVYRASDFHGGDAIGLVLVIVIGVHTPPQLSGIETSPLPYDAGTPAVAVTSNLTVSAPSSATLSGATVTIASGLAAAEDSLSFASEPGINGQYDSTSGVLTFSGTAPAAVYQAELRSVTFADPNGTNPTTGNRTISFQVNDGAPTGNLSNIASRTVIVAANPPPIAGAVSASTDKHFAVGIQVLSHASDPDGEGVSLVSVDTTGTVGKVTVNPNGTVTYDPNGKFESLNEGQSATDTFTYTVTDGFHNSQPGTVTVTINGSNDPPVLSGVESGALAYDAGTAAVPVSKAITVADPDDSTLVGATVSIGAGFVSGDDVLSLPTQPAITGKFDSTTGVLTLTGSASLADYQTALRSVTFADPNGASPTTGDRTISFQVNDGHASNNLSNTVSRTVTVAANPPPTAGDVTASTDYQTAIDINVLSHASDTDGDTLSVASVDTTGTKGSVSINKDGTVTYDPNGQFNSLGVGQTAKDSFGFTISDGFHSTSATATVTVNGPTHAPPVLANIESGAIKYDAGTPAVAVTSLLAVSDPDSTTLVGATVSITGGFASGEDVLSFTNQNGITGSYNASTGVLTLTGTASLTDYQDALRTVTYSDPNGTSPTVGDRTISFQVDDGAASGNLSNVVSRTVTVASNPPPTVSNATASTDYKTPVVIDVLSLASDPDGDTLSVASVDTTGTKGSVSINKDGTVTYDPNGQFNSLGVGQTAKDSFGFTISDGFQTTSATATVTVDGPTASPPVLANIESGALSYRAQDPAVAITSSLTVSDASSTTEAGATVSITGGFASGEDVLAFTNQNAITGSYNSSTGVLTLSGSASVSDYQAALRSVKFSTTDSSTSPASRSVSFTVADPSSLQSNTVTRTIDVSEANQPPTAVNQSYSAVGNTPLAVGTSPSGPVAKVSGSLLDGDSDPDSTSAVSVTANTQPVHGSVSVNPDGTFTYTPAAGYTGTDSFQYTITDSDDPANPKSASATVTIKVSSLVWYVDNAASGGGNGEAGAPFNTLAAANSAAGAGSIVFVYQGNGTYAGGVTLQSGESLLGQPHGLSVGGYALVAAGGSDPTITNASGDGIDLASGSDVEAINVSSPSANGISASGVGAATVGGTDPVGVSGAGGDGIHLSGGSGDLNLAGVSVTGSAGHSVSISGRTGGTVTIGGSISDTGTGIDLSSNAGATIDFTGKLTASSGANPAFSATGGGTVEATGSGSTLSTTSGTALDIENTTIGSSGLGFQSISANGGMHGIVLNSTGTNGGLSVTGTGSTTQGGDGSGGTIQNTTGDAISLSNTTAPSFNDMTIQSPALDGVNGTSVHGFTFTNSTVSNPAGSQTSSAEAALAFDNAGQADNIDGALKVSNDTIGIANGYASGAEIVNQSGTISDANISNNAITNTSSYIASLTTNRPAAIQLHLMGTPSSVPNVTQGEIDDNTIVNFPNGLGVDFEAGNTTGASSPAGSYGTPSGVSPDTFPRISINGNLIHGTSGSECQLGASGCMFTPIEVLLSGVGQGNFDVSGNGTQATPLGATIDQGIFFETRGNVSADASVTGNYLSGVEGLVVENSDCIIGTGSCATHLDNPQLTATIASNVVQNFTSNGLWFYNNDDQGSQGTANVKIVNNTVQNPYGDNNFGSSIEIDNGEGGGPFSEDPKLCAAISGNSAPAIANNINSPGITLYESSDRGGNNYPYGIVGLTDGSESGTESYVGTNNPGSTQGSSTYGSHGVFASANATWTASSCTLPVMP